MAIDKYVYRTRDPEMVAEWDAYQDEYQRWGRKVKRLIGSWFPRQGRGAMVLHSNWGSDDRWVGISGSWRDRNDLPEGWRWDNRTDQIVPHKSTKPGKVLAKVMADNQPPKSMRNRLRGMPSHLALGRYGMRTYQCGIERMGDALYVTWSIELTDEHDRKLWKKVRLSEFYRLRESEEAAA